jgi:hypothetical protein
MEATNFLLQSYDQVFDLTILLKMNKLSSLLFNYIMSPFLVIRACLSVSSFIRFTHFRERGFLEYNVIAIGYGLTESKADEEWTRLDRT